MMPSSCPSTSRRMSRCAQFSSSWTLVRIWAPLMGYHSGVMQLILPNIYEVRSTHFTNPLLLCYYETLSTFRESSLLFCTPVMLCDPVIKTKASENEEKFSFAGVCQNAPPLGCAMGRGSGFRPRLPLRSLHYGDYFRGENCAIIVE
jgi:hypothetical protein